MSRRQLIVVDIKPVLSSKLQELPARLMHDHHTSSVERIPELVAVSASDMLVLRAGFVELARGSPRTVEEIPVWSNQQSMPIGALDYSPDADPPVRVRIGRSRYLIGVGTYRIRAEDLQRLRALATRAYQRREREWQPTARLHPEALRSQRSASAERHDPISELRELFGSVYGPDEVRAAFTRASGERLVALPEASAQEFIKELAVKLRQPHIQELVDYLRRNPGEAKKWSLVFEMNATDDNEPFAIADLRNLLDQDSMKRGTGHLVLPTDDVLYKESQFYHGEQLITRQPAWTRATWRLARTDPLPGSIGRAPDAFAKLLGYYCDSRRLPTIKNHLFANGLTASHLLPSPVEAFYRRMLTVRQKQPSSYRYREWTAYHDDTIARAVIVYEPKPHGIEFKERDLLGGPEPDTGFILSIAL